MDAGMPVRRERYKTMEKPPKRVVISDLDNTLFDWFEIWHGGFRLMLDALIKVLGVSEEALLPQIKRIHEKHGTSEYAFLPEELPLLQERYKGDEFIAISRSIHDEFERGRSAAMTLYPGVKDTLTHLKQIGCLLVGYTESMAFYSNYRLRKLGLDSLLDFIYSPPDHQLPVTATVNLQLYTNHAARLELTKLRHTPGGEVKPNPKVLRQIVTDLQAEPSDCVYVGDDLMKDITMAKDAGITDVWVKYGVTRTRPEYELLRKFTHWRQSSVKRQKTLYVEDITPTYTLSRAFTW